MGQYHQLINKNCWEVNNGEVHDRPEKKILEAFIHCVNFHLLTMFRPNSKEVVKYYTTNAL
jgi:hypothetical protein